jgi:predicted nucleic acid-binding protein
MLDTSVGELMESLLDEHLLVLKRYREIPIMTPKEFWEKEK